MFLALEDSRIWIDVKPKEKRVKFKKLKVETELTILP